jgi:hypothetical protein
MMAHVSTSNDEIRAKKKPFSRRSEKTAFMTGVANKVEPEAFLKLCSAFFDFVSDRPKRGRLQVGSSISPHKGKFGTNKTQISD